MIQESKVTMFAAVCDDCGRTYGRHPRRIMAEDDLARHECGVHRQQHDSAGGFRGVLGGWNVSCICGKTYVTQNPSDPFHCPADSEGNTKGAK